MVDTIHRTLIIRFSSVGDIVLSSLLLRTLHKRFPECKIDFLVKKEYADLVRHNPHVSGVVEFPDDGGFGELWNLRRKIRDANYDLIVDIHDSLRSRFLCFGLPSAVRVNKRKIARFFLVRTKWDVYEWFGGSPSVAERYIEPVLKLGVLNDGDGLDLFYPQTASDHAKKILQESGIANGTKIIGISPVARHNTKMWLKERFAETASTLARDYKAAVVLFGSGKDENDRCQEIKTIIEHKSPGITVLNLAGTMSLLETAAMIDSCSLIITNDSGLMHVAAARKRKVVAIFGSTVRELGFFPYGTTSTVIENINLPCRPCTHIGLPACPKKHFKCMNDICASDVINAARLLIKS